MFRVTFICDDKNLGRAMRALVGIASEPPQVQPMSNAVAKRGKVRQKFEGGTMAEMVAAQLIKKGLTKVKASDISTTLTELGYSSGSVATCMANMQNKFGVLKRISEGVYQVRNGGTQ